MHTGFDLEVNAIFTFFNGCLVGADPPPLLYGAQVVYLWFKAPFYQVMKPLRISIEHHDGALNASFAQGHTFFSKGHSKPRYSQSAELYCDRITRSVCKGFDHPHDGKSKALPVLFEVVGEPSQIQVEYSGVWVRLQCTGDPLKGKRPCPFDQDVPALQTATLLSRLGICLNPNTP